MLIRLTAVLLLSNRFSSAALFVLLAASAWAWIVWIDLTLCALYRFSRAGLVFVGSGHFGYLLTFYFLLNTYMEQETDGILLDGLEHFVKHVVSCHLVLNLRVSLAVCLQADTLAELIHIIDMIHPLLVDNLQKNDTLKLTNLLLLREFCFFLLVEFNSFLF